MEDLVRGDVFLALPPNPRQMGGAGHAYYFRVTEDLRHIVWTSVGKRQHPNDHVGAINLASLTDVVMHPLQFLPPIYQPEFVFAIKSRDQTLLLHATDALSLVRWVSCLQHYLLVVRGASLSSPQDKGTVVVSRRRLTRGGFLWKIFLVRYKSRARTANKSFLKYLLGSLRSASASVSSQPPHSAAEHKE